MEQQQNDAKKGKGKGGLFIPAGLFIGMGVGMLVNNISAGMFIDLDPRKR